jgi:hypothetical protein
VPLWLDDRYKYDERTIVYDGAKRATMETPATACVKVRFSTTVRIFNGVAAYSFTKRRIRFLAN